MTSLAAPLTVFIADDSAVVRDRLAALLGGVPGVNVVGLGGTPAEAIDGVRRLRPRLLVLDLQLAGGSGVDVLADVRGLGPAPVVAVLTNHPTPQHRRTCLANGADYFLDKTTQFDLVVDLARGLAADARRPHRDE